MTWIMKLFADSPFCQTQQILRFTTINMRKNLK